MKKTVVLSGLKQLPEMAPPYVRLRDSYHLININSSLSSRNPSTEYS